MLTPAEYIKAGFRVAPIKKGGAHPPFDNWQNREFKVRDFKQGHSIAIVCGKPDRNPVVDVDLDHELAIRLASAVLPNTGCVFGRLSAPSSHRLYRSKGATHKWHVNGIGMLVELRSKGATTLVPPSVHSDSGEERAWEECKPAQMQAVSYKELKKACNVLASAALLAHHWPTRGMRHEYALGVGGWFAKEMGQSVAQVEKIIRKMMSCVTDEEPDDRIRAAKESAEKHHAGNNVSAFNTLEPIMGKPHAIILRQWSDKPTKGGAKPAGKNQSESIDEDADSIPAGSIGVTEALSRMSVDVRCNLRTMGSEFRIDNKELARKLRHPPKEDWIEDSDDLDAVLRVTTETTMTFGSGKSMRPASFSIQKWNDGILYARSENMVDPFMVWLESLPNWDGKDRLWDLVDTIWELAYPAEKDYSCWALATRLIAAVARTYEPGSIADEMIILQSNREGIMKSTSIGLMFPSDSKLELRRSAWLHEGLKLDVFDPRQPLENIGQAVFVEASEMQGGRKADVERLRSWLSQRRDRHRFAYAKKPVTIPRRFIIFGTANPVECLPSDTGDMRRYLPVSLKKRLNGHEAREWFNNNREQLWAEALEHYKNGATHYLEETGAIREQHRNAVNRHRGGAAAAEYAADRIFDKMEDPIKQMIEHDTQGRPFVRSTEIHRVADELSMGKGEVHLIWKGLRLRGWNSTVLWIGGKSTRVWMEDETK